MNLTNRAARAVRRLFEMTPTSTNKGIISIFLSRGSFTGQRQTLVIPGARKRRANRPLGEKNISCREGPCRAPGVSVLFKDFIFFQGAEKLRFWAPPRSRSYEPVSNSCCC